MPGFTETPRVSDSLSVRVPAMFAGFALLMCLLAVQQTFAANFVVNQSGDAGDLTCDATCTLRDAVDDANAPAATNDTISFAAGLTTINLTSQIFIDNAGTLTIMGNGANALTIDGGAGTNRIFLVNSAIVTIRGVTMSGGGGGNGNSGMAVQAAGGTITLEEVVVQNNAGENNNFGAVFFFNGTNHRIVNSTFTANNNFVGCAAIYTESTTLTILNTTISGNSSPGGSGGAICFSNTTGTIRNTTISGNTAGSGFGGGGIYIQSGATVDLGNTIVAGNSASTGPDLSINGNGTTSVFTTSGGNLIGNNSGGGASVTFPTGNANANGDKVGTTGSVINPLLDALANNGGTTPTRALLPRSPALDSGINALATAAGLTSDQRGSPRIRDGNGDTVATVDSGAFEQQVSTAAMVSIGGRVMTETGRGITGVVVTMIDSGGNVRTTVSAAGGRYRFETVEASSTYIITATGKRFTFRQAAQVVNVDDETDEINFIANPTKRFGT